MKKITHLFMFGLVLTLGVQSCEKEAPIIQDEISRDVIDKIAMMGFNPDGIERVEEGFRIERDIIITHQNLEEVYADHRVPEAEQYRTFNTVSTNGNRTITIYMSVEGSGGGGNGNGKGGNGGGGGDFPAIYGDALDEAVARYNAENLDLDFQRVASSGGADIVISRLGKGDERRGVLGSAGFPSSGGDPYGTIRMSGILASTYGLSVNGIATILAHEMGHCIGFRHTDWFDRSISCGGPPSNEGQETSGVGAVHIPGTPTGATYAARSWMLSCTDGGNRPFNHDDKTALDWMYVNNF